MLNYRGLTHLLVTHQMNENEILERDKNTPNKDTILTIK